MRNDKFEEYLKFQGDNVNSFWERHIKWYIHIYIICNFLCLWVHHVHYIYTGKVSTSLHSEAMLIDGPSHFASRVFHRILHIFWHTCLMLVVPSFVYCSCLRLAINACSSLFFRTNSASPAKYSTKTWSTWMHVQFCTSMLQNMGATLLWKHTLFSATSFFISAHQCILSFQEQVTAYKCGSMRKL